MSMKPSNASSATNKYVRFPRLKHRILNRTVPRDINPLGRCPRVERADREIRWYVLLPLQGVAQPIPASSAETMFELVNALNTGATELRRQNANPIGLNAGCELFIAFVTLFPHNNSVRFCSACRMDKVGANPRLPRVYRSSNVNLYVRADSTPRRHLPIATKLQISPSGSSKMTLW